MERYRLAELADVSGVTARTIRYYIAEGLLPAPEGAGPAAVYTAAHRDRLALINDLKGRYLPLREIHRRLAALTDDEVRAAVRQLTAIAPPEGATNSGGESGDGIYLDNARGQGQHNADPPLASAGATRSQSSPAPRQPSLAREQWERVALADGVELHVRADRLREAIPLDALVRQARELLDES